MKKKVTKKSIKAMIENEIAVEISYKNMTEQDIKDWYYSHSLEEIAYSWSVNGHKTGLIWKDRNTGNVYATVSESITCKYSRF